MVRVGSWRISSGTWTPTRQDIAAAVAALDCPAIRKPVIKLGHQGFGAGDAEPALGWYENLRTADGGHTLVADQVALPWLHDVQAAAYPDRSVEGHYSHRCALGHTHPFVITAVAQLGVTPPGVGTLRSIQDLPDALGVAATGDVPDGARAVQVTIRAAAEAQTGAMVALIPSDEDAQRLAVDGGEPAEQLHVTLAYLGDAAEIPTRARQQILTEVMRAVAGLPPLTVDAFAVAAFNPRNPDRDTCVVLNLSGDGLTDVKALVGAAVMHAQTGPVGFVTPQQHTPWTPHVTLAYTDDLSRVVEWADRTGPVTFDRVRVAFGGEHTDIPLTGVEDDPGEVFPADLQPVAAAAGDANLRAYWITGKGGAKIRWNTPGDFTRCVRQLRKHVRDPKGLCAEYHKAATGMWPGDRRNRRDKVAASIGDAAVSKLTAEAIRQAWNATSGAPVTQWVVEARPHEVIVVDDTDRSFTRVPVLASGDQILFGAPEPYDPETEKTVVFASRAESRPDPPPGPAPADPPAPTDDGGGSFVPAEPATVPAPAEPPAAEPDQPTTEEDTVSTLSTDVRQRLGLADDADEAAALAAIDALKEKAETPPTPDPELVAASAAERDELAKQVDLLSQQVQSLSQQIADANAEKAATVKASVMDAAVADGKIAPAQREQWEADYDEAPNAVTRVLASIAPGTAVPVMASGHTGPAEPAGDIDAEWAQVSHVFPPETAGTGA